MVPKVFEPLKFYCIYDYIYRDDIYFFEVNAIYILEMSIISRVCSTSEISDILNT